MSYKLGEICEFYRGASTPRDRMYDEGDWLYVHYGDLYKGFSYRIDVERPQKRIPFILASEPIKSSQRLEDQDIVYVLTSETEGDLGHSYLFNNPFNRPSVAGTETTIVRVRDTKVILPAYLNYLMHTPMFLGQLRQYVRGMKVFRVHPKDVARIEIEVPSIENQRKVVSILDAIYEKQILNSLLNDYLEELALTLYAENLEWGEAELPSGWQFRPLSDFFPVVTGKKDANIALDNGAYPFFTCKQSALLTDTYSFDGSAILVAGNGDFNVKWYEGKFEAYQRTYVLIPDDPVLLGYLYCAVKRNLSEITSGSRGSVIKFITKGNIADYEIAVPPNPEQNSTIKQLRKILELIDAFNREMAQLETLRDVLLPKLMSGEIDVSQVDLSQLNNHLAA